MKKIILLTASALLLAGSSHAQSDNAPRKGAVTIAATVGYNSYAGIDAPVPMQSDYQLAAAGTQWSDSKLMVGIEGQWFVTDGWALRFGGGLGYTYEPGYAAVPGTIDGTEFDQADIPNYGAVGNASSLKYTVYVGMNRYWKLARVPNLLYYTGFHLGISYGQNQINADGEQSMGTAASEVINSRAAWTVGADYYVLPSMFIGIEVHPLAYTYNVTGIRPQAGLKMLRADSHNISVFAAPTLKIGFKF